MRSEIEERYSYEWMLARLAGWVVAVRYSSHVQGRAGMRSCNTVVKGPYFRISRKPITAALRWAAATKLAGWWHRIICCQLRNLTLFLVGGLIFGFFWRRPTAIAGSLSALCGFCTCSCQIRTLTKASAAAALPCQSRRRDNF